MERRPPRSTRTYTHFPYTTVCRSAEGGFMSSMTVCANGTMNAPATPWNNRNATISGRVVAMPHNMDRSEEHTSELQSLMRISYAVFCLKKKTKQQNSPNKLSDKVTSALTDTHELKKHTNTRN